ncbi:MAG TPA: GNAT family protein [Symbiobacteriaceae bacterium]|nr:GNAT family protein [Symbiobacteriaceae bacterium]
MAELGPVLLSGTHIRLEPLRPHHAPELLLAGRHPEIWPWMSQSLTTEAAVARFIADALKAEEKGLECAFAVVSVSSGKVLGSTRYMDVQAAHRGLEIGWTWYTPEVWGTVVNPEAKFLLLRHAFESWGALRVQLKTDGRNLRSQAAIRKLGAQYEGTLRNHRIRPDGTVRDTAMFSIIDTEWPAIKSGLVRVMQSLTK